MKKILILSLILLGLTFAMVADSIESDLYYKSFPISKVYPSTEGYRVVYMKGDMTYHVFYVPMNWFVNGTDGKGEVIYGEGAIYPYFTVYWKEGAFSHIKLYLPQSLLDPAWGDMPDSIEASKFDVTEPNLEF